MRLIPPGSTIGMLGGGQLGRMFTFKAKQMGYNVLVFDPAPNSPAGQVADAQIVADFDDEPALHQLAEKCEVITYEFENVAVRAVEWLESWGQKVFPDSRVLKIAQNRWFEKEFLRDCGIGVTDFCKVTSLTELEVAAQQVGFPGLLKTASGGYDGKGQLVLENEEAAFQAFKSLNHPHLIWEKKVPFSK
jgi:5-(carboxyamino)imidazole ribonucleotide synthase